MTSTFDHWLQTDTTPGEFESAPASFELNNPDTCSHVWDRIEDERGEVMCCSLCNTYCGVRELADLGRAVRRL